MFQGFSVRSSINRVNYSGVYVGTLRDHTSHKQNVTQTLAAVTPTQRNELQTESRFNELMSRTYGGGVSGVSGNHL